MTALEEIENLHPFNPQDPEEVMADEIRKSVASMAFCIFSDPKFRELPTHRQIEVMTGGILTGLMGVIYSFIEDTLEGHDELERFVTSYVPHARAQAEAIASQEGLRQ